MNIQGSQRSYFPTTALVPPMMAEEGHERNTQIKEAKSEK